MTKELALSLDQARRLAVRSQHLAGPLPDSGLDGIRQVLGGLRVLQIRSASPGRRRSAYPEHG